ncbi:hypothetical protein PGT21_025225 [Puccinia graminis f. sp. tritici]|uniref:Uncharacterized protein n=1 Tax=Puccinia graminis f. sp. tritici TaxID=56615 RepID=A0A5B0NGK2_PUCGR|nr:hypothetical protein PGT21_025225 [Puccinia graminis f. sp. tritici]
MWLLTHPPSSRTHLTNLAMAIRPEVEPVHKMLVALVTRPLTTLRLPSTTSKRVTEGGLILNSLPTTRALIVVHTGTGVPLVPPSNKMKTFLPPTRQVAPLAVLPTKRHPQTIHPSAQNKFQLSGWRWVQLVMALFWILGQPTTGHLKITNGDGILTIPRVLYSLEMTSENQASEGRAIKPAPQRWAGGIARPFWRGGGVGVWEAGGSICLLP